MIEILYDADEEHCAGVGVRDGRLLIGYGMICVDGGQVAVVALCNYDTSWGRNRVAGQES